MSLEQIGLAALAALLGVISFFVKHAIDDARDTEKNLASFREEVAKLYLTKAEHAASMGHIEASLDKINEKLDRMGEAIGRKADR